MKLNKFEQVISLLNISFGKSDNQNFKPFSIKEWSNFAKYCLDNKIDMEEFLKNVPEKIIQEFHNNPPFLERIKYLLNRGTSLAISLEKWERAGIWLKFRKDHDYPMSLKEKLKSKSPVIFFGVGDYSILNKDYIGIVGSRNPCDDDIEFTEKFVKFLIAKDLNVISGGARGVDLKSMTTCIQNGGNAIGILADSLLKQSVSKQFREFLSSGKLLLLSSTNPEAGFNVGFAMQRNKYIYCMSKKTLIITCTPNKGGTWSGAIENYNHKWVQMYVQKSEINQHGNKMLEGYGAIPIENNKNDFQKLINAEHEIKLSNDVKKQNSNILTYEDFLETLKNITKKKSLSSQDIYNQIELNKINIDEYIKKGLSDKKVIKYLKQNSYSHHTNIFTQKDLFD
jgi:predicted Rossmann fold nucleotide-binding protein DprA/Smf involved in DNA uptake